MSDPRGVLRPVGNPEAEVMRLSRERQITAGQICAEMHRGCDEDCGIGPVHCRYWHQPPLGRSHDPAHCDRMHSGGDAA